jgi:hypothetical protein
MEELEKSLSNLNITIKDDKKELDKAEEDKIKEKNIIKIQKIWRGYNYRLKSMPLIMYKIQAHLQSINFVFSVHTGDGRTNSTLDEPEIIKSLVEKFGDRIQVPKERHFCDFLAKDYIYGILPINIKTTTTLTSDNTGNMAMCVHAYTDYELDLDPKKEYVSGKMSEILFNKIKEKKYNKNNKKDYYFVVLNKTDNKDIIVNSVKGLSLLTANINNLPFQICWNKNRKYEYKNINSSIKQFIECLQKPKPSWKETFMKNIRTISL